MLCISNMATMDYSGTHYKMFFSTVTAQEVHNFISSHDKIKLYNFALSSIKSYKESVKDANSEYCRKYSQLAVRRNEELKKNDVEKEKLKQELEYAMEEGERLFQENKELKQELESLKQFELDRILDASMCEIMCEIDEPLLLF